MESLKSFESKIKYRITGHSGESDEIELVNIDNPPKNENEILKVILKMYAHSQYCWSGDSTVKATKKSLKNLQNAKYDEKFLFFTRNFYLLEYILYVMKINYKNILENNSTIKQNEYEKLAFLRQDVTRENLQKNILYFEEKFDIIKRKIIN